MHDVKYEPFSKVCTRCGHTKLWSEFSMTSDKRRKRQTLKPECRACATERACAWQQAHKEHAYQQQKQWRTENKPRFNELMRDISKRYIAAKKRATPSWADQGQIEAVYTEAWCRRFFGEDVEVDHHYPFQGKTVCGFHVHQNLRIVPRLRNRSKRNSHPGD